MAKYDFFISYSTKDKDIAFKIVDAIESTGHSCWIAPRDIPYGTPYARAIMEGIDGCNAFMVLITDNSIKSEDVLNEVDNAHASRKKIIPVRLTETKLPRELNYYLSRTQWVVLPSDSPASIIRLLGLEAQSADSDWEMVNPDNNGDGRKNKTTLILIASIAICIGTIVWMNKDYISIDNKEETLSIEDIAIVEPVQDDSLKENAKKANIIAPKTYANQTKANERESLISIIDGNPITLDDLILNADYFENADDYAEALTLYKEIASNYDQNYAHKVGYMYEHGQGVDANPAEASRWYKIASDYGNPEAQMRLGHMLLSMKQYYDGASYCLKAENYYLKPENRKIFAPVYKNDLGLIYYNGYGVVSADREKAKKYFMEAMIAGDPAAKSNFELFFKK